MANIIEITDFNSPQLDIYARMSEGHLLNRHEPEKGIFIAESPKVVERALDAGCEPISMLVEHKHACAEDSFPDCRYYSRGLVRTECSAFDWYADVW